MQASEQRNINRLSRLTQILLVLGLILTILHHADHVLRVDHSGWPFRPIVTPFTFSLLVYPMILFALLGPPRLFWIRWILLAIGAALTLLAHAFLESPQMQYTMWADDRSLSPQSLGLHNLLGLHSQLVGGVAVAISITLNAVAALATASMLMDRLRLPRVAVATAA